MKITISKSIRHDLHAEIKQLVNAGFKGTNTKGVEVHVKGRAPRVRWRITTAGGALYGTGVKHDATRFAAAHPGSTLERYVRIREAFTGRAYGSIPSIANVGQGVKYLVTLMVPTDPTIIDYPKREKYPGLKTAPEITLYSWQEHVVYLTAHEANHIRQFQNKRPRSEIKCERWAVKVLDSWRSARARLFIFDTGSGSLLKTAYGQADEPSREGQ